MAKKKLEVVISGDAAGARKALGETEKGATSLQKKIGSTSRKINDASRSTDGFSSKLSGLGSKAVAVGRKIAVGLAVGVGALVAGAAVGLKSAVEAAQESAKISRETERVIRTTGGAANVTAKQVSAYAGTLAQLTGVDDEIIQQGANLLLTFTNVRNEVGKGNDIFNQSVAISNDMAAVLGTDVSSAAMLVGKAMNDPIKGLTALTRSGVSFTQQQKDQIKWLAASGDVMGAQKIIMGELNKEFGGGAAAAATPLDRLRVTIGNLQETIGAALIPVLDKVVGWLSDKLPKALAVAKEFWNAFTSGFTEDEGTKVESYGLKVREVAMVILNAGRAVVEWWKANWPAIQQTIAISVAWFQAEALPRIRAFIDGVVEKFRQIIDWVKVNWPAFQEAITHVLAALQAYWNTFGQRILANVRNVWNIVYAVVKTVINLVAGIIRTVTAVINGDWGKAWEAVKQTFTRVWGAVPGILGNALAIVRRVLGAAFDGWKSMVGEAVGWIIGRFGAVAGGLARALGGVASTITAPFRNAVQMLKNIWNNTIGGKGFSVPSWVPGLGGKSFSIPRLHTGGTFRAPSPGGQGLALLRDGERVSTPSSDGGGVTIVLNSPIIGGPRELADMLKAAQRQGYLPKSFAA